MASSTVQYGILVAILGGYVAILGYGVATGTTTVAPTDLYAGVLLLGIVTVRSISDQTIEPGLPETVAFVIAGVAIGYDGVSALSAAPPVEYINTIGDLGLIAGLLLLVDRTVTSQRPAVAE
jgi:uncharacterized membrane protein